MNSSWLIPMFIGLNSFGEYNTTLCSCVCLGEYNRYSRRYKKYGDD